jgi:hypothetical protein
MARVALVEVWDPIALRFADAPTTTPYAQLVYSKTRQSVQMGPAVVIIAPQKYDSVLLDFSNNDVALSKLKMLDDHVLKLAKQAGAWKLLGRNPSDEEVENAYRPCITEDLCVNVKTNRAAYFNEEQTKVEKDVVVEGCTLNTIISPAYLCFKDDKFSLTLTASQAMVMSGGSDGNECMFVL